MTVDKQSINNFTTIWLKYESQSSDQHQLFLKAHSVRKQELEYPRGQTLFLLNIPSYVTPDSLKNAFISICGPVRSVTLTTDQRKAKTGFKVGYIVFEKESGLDKALMLPKNYIMILQTAENPTCLTGVIKWCKEYNNSLSNETVIKKEIETYMSNYDARIANRLAREKAAEEGRDNEGWVTVTGRKKRGQYALSRKESTISKVQHKDEQKSKKKQLLNFYTFQIRESKKQNLAELRKKFELDKNKLQQLKLKRTFKPF